MTTFLNPHEYGFRQKITVLILHIISIFLKISDIKNKQRSSGGQEREFIALL
jgi:hypothetical protein